MAEGAHGQGIVERLAEGVHAFVQPDGSWWVNNAGFVDGGGHVVLVDTCATERRTRALLDAVDHHAPGTITGVVNTHFHGDHTNGNCLVPDALVIAHGTCRDDVRGNTIGGLEAVWDPVDWGELTVRPPDVTFHDRLDLAVGDHEVQLLHPGTTAHTRDDCVVWLPGPRILFAGDLVFNGGTPFVVMGSVSGSLEANRWLRSLEPEVIVPGHGPVCDVSVLDGIDDYLRLLQELAREGVTAGDPPLAVARRAELGPFAGLLDAERLAANLHRAYAEERDEADIDGMAAFGDMLALNGGPLPTHA